MNFVGHIHLALVHLDGAGPGRTPGAVESSVPDPDGGAVPYLVGSALPDFAAMGRFRLTGRPGDEGVRAGIELHHRTDDAFHRHPWFRSNSTAVAEQLEARGLSRGAARACGHVGIELLLDGHLLAGRPALRTSTQRALRSAGEPRLGLVVAVEEHQRPAWRDHLDTLSSWSLPEDYGEADAVAERLRRILARRPRLAFGDDEVHLVGRVLAERKPTLEAGTDELVADLAETLAA